MAARSLLLAVFAAGEEESLLAVRRKFQTAVAGLRQSYLHWLAACNRLHEAEERLARWLLTAHDLTGTDSILLNQGLLADILGARRTTVTLAAGALRRRKLISYSRGHIKILDRARLKKAACECYGTVSSLFQNYYG